MKKIALLLLVLTGVSSFSFIQETMQIIVPGKGIEGYVTVDLTTKREVTVKFGNGFTEVKNYIGEGKNKKLYSTKQVYKKQGISFYYRPSSGDTVFCVHITAPYKAKTDKGIVPGTSTMQEVWDAYGEAEWYTTGETMSLEYPGISFYIDGKGWSSTEALEKKVKTISVKGFDPQ